MEIKLPPDFKEFFRLLKEKQVEYLLIGGYAVGYYGYPHATQDIDIWIAIGSENAKRMVTVLKEFGFNTSELSGKLFLESNNIVRLGEPPLRVEVINTISGVTFDECYTERVSDIIDGTEFDIISLHHLKINKKASGRHKDLDDLENLPESNPP